MSLWSDYIINITLPAAIVTRHSALELHFCPVSLGLISFLITTIIRIIRKERKKTLYNAVDGCTTLRLDSLHWAEVEMPTDLSPIYFHLQSCYPKVSWLISQCEVIERLYRIFTNSKPWEKNKNTSKFKLALLMLVFLIKERSSFFC